MPVHHVGQALQKRILVLQRRNEFSCSPRMAATVERERSTRTLRRCEQRLEGT
jgi:hypothetical protein